MGGHALHTVDTVRLGRAAYQSLAARVVVQLSALWPECYPCAVRSLPDKADFGDLDVLVVRSGLPADVASSLREAFGATEVVHNGDVWSFDYAGFQVDLVTVRVEDRASAVDYFAWGDAGNLLGRVAKKLGFTFGFDGLSYKLRDGSRLLFRVPVSHDVPAVFAFLGYDAPGSDYAAYEAGFDSRASLFRFVASSRYFDPASYDLARCGHQARARDRKRPGYSAFLQWLADKNVPPGASSDVSRADHLARAFREFPDFQVAVAEVMASARRDQLRQEVFNGRLVCEWTGREGKSLGALMARCRTTRPAGYSDFDTFLDTSDVSGVRAYVVKLAHDNDCLEDA